MDKEIEIEQFLDENGKITQMPRKRDKRKAVLKYLAEKFEPNISYSERQVNEICNCWHTFGDFYLLRRELVDSGCLCRERDGSRYWREIADEAKSSDE